MTLIDLDRFRESVNHDPEFLMNARFWSILFKVEAGEIAFILSLDDGKIAEINENPSSEDPWALKISAPLKDWKEFLKPVPRPFYHDVFAAWVHHEFACKGDFESFYAYYPAVRRMFEIMRRVASA